MEDFGGLLSDLWRANEDVTMPNEKPIFVAKRIDFDPSGFGAAMVGGEPSVESQGESANRGFVDG